jgi:hypothetical protein
MTDLARVMSHFHGGPSVKKGSDLSMKASILIGADPPDSLDSSHSRVDLSLAALSSAMWMFVSLSAF